MSLHFEGAEFSQRINRLRELMAENELDGMLLFRQESMFYLGGYDTFGYVFFQCLYLGLMCFGQSYMVNDSGCECLSRHSLELVVR